jgi:hypothetical protein
MATAAIAQMTTHAAKDFRWFQAERRPSSTSPGSEEASLLEKWKN